MTSNAQYRPELDGLRAIAVLAVLFYHLDQPWIPGGFMGVDVFFVLSGFLITGILQREIDGRGFHIRHFIGKRIRRLLPALLTMVLVVFAVGIAMLDPVPLIRLAESAIAQPFALQNVYFFMDGEYFANAKHKPLLHTWSLGIEEQFYLIWPLAMVALMRVSARTRIALAIALVGASFALNLVVMGISPKAAFFLLPTRAWELGVGCILALVHAQGHAKPTRGIANALFGASIVALFGILGFYTTSMPFPGTTALIPSLATCGLLVAMSNHDGVGTRLLSLTPLPAIGKLSYSLYLWHWPLIVFARLAGVDVKTPIAVLALVSVSFGLAWLSLHYVEEPIRRKRVLTRTPAFAAGLISVILSLVVVSVTTTRTQGLAFRFTEPHRSMLTAGLNADGDDRCGLVYRATRPRAATCELAHSPNATRRVLVWGNSHAAMWAGVFASLATEHQASFYLTAKNCRATADSDFCGKAYQDAVLNEIQSQGITDVVLISSWYGAYGIPDADFESALSSII